MKRMLILTIALLATPTMSRAQTFTSGPVRTDLIELFTSEGCSSCPPADRKMNALVEKKKLWKEFVPVAFHVDYWDYLGWKDPYSSATFSARQRRYTKQWHARTSYTPCFVVNGVAARQPVSSGHIDQTGRLKAMLDGDKATITFSPIKANGDYIAWLAPLSGKLDSSVTAGENRGRSLEHCFVALGLVNGKMNKSGSTCSATLTLPADARTQAIAVWVSLRGSQTPLQATGGWL